MPSKMDTLSIGNHDRDVLGLSYVYPVVSRRSGGVSIGINLNTNNACNWHCAYCQVPDLRRGSAPPVDIDVLTGELRGVLQAVLYGDFMARHVPSGCRKLCDLALSGNGEPTSSAQFDEVVLAISQVMHELGLAAKVPLILITNGSYLHKAHIQQALSRIAALDGELWLKVDRATVSGSRLVNGVSLTPGYIRGQIEGCVALCPTWIQSCMMCWDGQPPDRDEQEAYLDLMRWLVDSQLPVRGVRLYGLARPSLQPEAEHLSQLALSWMQAFARRIEACGVPVLLTP